MHLIEITEKSLRYLAHFDTYVMSDLMVDLIFRRFFLFNSIDDFRDCEYGLSFPLKVLFCTYQNFIYVGQFFQFRILYVLTSLTPHLIGGVLFCVELQLLVGSLDGIDS